jgi:phage terminase small subunit
VCTTHGGRAPQVRAAADQRIKDVVADLVDPDKILREVGWIARFDPRSLFDVNGNLLAVKDWPDGTAAAVSSIEVVKRNVYVGDDKVDDVIKVRLADKLKALEMLFKHLGLLTERLEHSGGIEIRWKGPDD